jgi:phosphoesterase RecJ-like protein
MNSEWESLRTLLNHPCNIAITTHQRPDGDAMGSSLALYNYLTERGHQAQVITPTDYPEYFNWMPGNDNVWVYTQNKQDCEIYLENADILFCLDFNTLPRISPMDTYVSTLDVPIVLIDHHLKPDTFQWSLSNTKACSTCELVFQFIHLMEDKPTISKDVAHCIYTGLYTDTGGFQNGAVNKAAFTITAALLDAELDIHYVLDQLNGNGSENRVRFLGNSLLNKMTVNNELGLAFIVVDRKDARTYSLQSGDTEGLVNYPLSIKGINISVLIKEEKDIIKLSFRSKGNISVDEICRAHFEGGGHRNAAGGRTILTPPLAIKKITEVVDKHLKINKIV